MAKRKIIEIDRDACNGCGLCTTACAEGALELDNEEKAVLIREIYCDGMGACLDVCPTGALKIVERESDTYDAQKTFKHVLKTRGRDAADKVHGIEKEPAPHEKAHFSGCPGSTACAIPVEGDAGEEDERSISGKSQLSQWPIQLHLISPYAPYFRGSDLLVAADCTAFALGGFHQNLLKGKKVVIACPKLDDREGYVEKLAELIKQNDLKSLTVAIMTVPCCSGLLRMVEQALELSGNAIELNKVVVGIDGKIAAKN